MSFEVKSIKQVSNQENISTVYISESPISTLPNELISKIFKHLNIENLFKIREICSSWRDLVDYSFREIRAFDFSYISKITNDTFLIKTVASFPNLREIDLTNCSKITNAGLVQLSTFCSSLQVIGLEFCKLNGQITYDGVVQLAVSQPKLLWIGLYPVEETFIKNLRSQFPQIMFNNSPYP